MFDCRISGRTLGIGLLVVVASLQVIPATTAFAGHGHDRGRRNFASESIRYTGRPFHPRFARYSQAYGGYRDRASESIRYTGRPLHPRYTRYRQAFPASRSHDGSRDLRYRVRRDRASESIRYTGRPLHPRFARYRQVYGCASPPLVQPTYIVQEAPAARRREHVRREPTQREPTQREPTPREPTQRAILERATLADGSVRMIIRSVPIEPRDAGDERAPETAIAESGSDVALRKDFATSASDTRRSTRDLRRTSTAPRPDG